MNAAPRSSFSHPSQSRRPTPRSRATHLSPVARMPSKTTGQKVARITPTPHLTPLWLQMLLTLQRGSDLMTLLLVTATLTIYSWTVYTQQQWAKEYRKLESLQRHERHLTTTNEVIKDQLAQQAENPSAGLVTPSTSNSIFLQPAPQRQANITPTQVSQPVSTTSTPLGY